MSERPVPPNPHDYGFEETGYHQIQNSIGILKKEKSRLTSASRPEIHRNRDIGTLFGDQISILSLILIPLSFFGFPILAFVTGDLKLIFYIAIVPPGILFATVILISIPLPNKRPNPADKSKLAQAKKEICSIDARIEILTPT